MITSGAILYVFKIVWTNSATCQVVICTYHKTFDMCQ